jgi:Fe-S-cluster-containing hydrogenase component 2
MKMDAADIQCYSFQEFSYETNNSVCPVDAISVGADSIHINETNCIGCGLCVSRCPFGAIHFERGKATLNRGNSHPLLMVKLDVTSENLEKQRRFLKNMIPSYRSGCMRIENDEVMTDIYERIKHLSQSQQNIMVRNLLIELGCQAALSRQGNVYSRMDGFYENSRQMGVLEIETGSEMLDVSRALLDDAAVVNARYAISLGDDHPLAVVLSLPNKRTDYWQVVKDINVVVDLKISTLTFGALLLFLWNCEDVSEFDKFYVDVDDYSIRENVEQELNRKINISEGLLGILENSK